MGLGSGWLSPLSGGGVAEDRARRCARTQWVAAPTATASGGRGDGSRNQGQGRGVGLHVDHGTQKEQLGGKASLQKEKARVAEAQERSGRRLRDRSQSARRAGRREL